MRPPALSISGSPDLNACRGRRVSGARVVNVGSMGSCPIRSTYTGSP
jgi:hypothetical protein